MKERSLFGLTMILTTWVVLLPVCATSSQAIKARPEQIVQRQPNCNNPTTNLEIKECIRLRYQAADRRLNEVYQQLNSKVSAEERSLLVEAQRGWIQLRDKNCEFEVYRNRGGTGYRGFLNECLERMTKQRTTELENSLKDRVGIQPFVYRVILVEPTKLPLADSREKSRIIQRFNSASCTASLPKQQ